MLNSIVSEIVNIYGCEAIVRADIALREPPLKCRRVGGLTGHSLTSDPMLRSDVICTCEPMTKTSPAPLILAASVGGFASKSLPEVDRMATLSRHRCALVGLP
jgi:hypothetical protein